MSLRIPLTSDQTLQVEFHEIERRLRKIEKGLGVNAGSTSVIKVSGGSGGASTVNLQPIYDRLDVIETTLLDLAAAPAIVDYRVVGASSAAGLVPDPGTSEPPTGVAQHVLTEDNEWGFPLRGLIGVSTSGEQTDPPYEVVDILGAVSIAGGLTVDEIICRDVTVLGESDLLLTQRGGVWLSPAGATTATAWRAPYPCTVVNLRGLRTGGTGATLNARRNGASNHLVSDLSLTAAGTWMDGGVVQNAAYAVGDSLEFMLQSVAGGPTEVAIQVDFRRART